jgi:hypothetical protein
VTRSAELSETAWARIEPLMPRAGGLVRNVIIARWSRGRFSVIASGWVA